MDEDDDLDKVISAKFRKGYPANLPTSFQFHLSCLPPGHFACTTAS